MTTYIPSITLPSFVFEQPALSILLPVVLGSAVGWSTRHIAYQTMTWDTADRSRKTYRELKQPPFSPPPWVFGPVWTVLYASMGYAAYRAWTTGQNAIDPRLTVDAKHGATLYTAQLGLNLIWMPLFFGLYRPTEAAVDMFALIGTTSYLAYVWHKVDAVSAWLLLPYLGWLGFAAYLSIGVGHLNNWDFTKTPTAGEKKAT